MKTNIMLTMLSALTAGIARAQDMVTHTALSYDPDQYKIIPDKVFEIGVPLLVVLIIVQMIGSMLKTRAEHRLKHQMISKGISEETLVKIFAAGNAVSALQPLKWSMLAFALALSLIIIHFSRAALTDQSGYLAVGIILLCLSAAFGIYYYALSKKIKQEQI